MTEEDLFSLSEEFRSLITSPSFTRDDLTTARATFQQLGLSKTACSAIFPLIAVARSEVKNEGARVQKQYSEQCINTLISIAGTARSGPVHVDVDVDASSRVASAATSYSKAFGDVKMGDKIRIDGDVSNSAVGSSARFNARDVTSFKQVIATAAIDDDLKAVLIKAREMLDSAGLPPGDTEDVADDLGKFAAEMEKPDKDPSRIAKIWQRIQDAAPTVASVLASAVSVAKLVSGQV